MSLPALHTHMYIHIYVYIYIYIHIHLTKPSKFIFQILGSMGPPPWEDNTVPLAPDGGHYVNARSTYPYVYIYIYMYVYIYIYTHTSNNT